jgi:hypothetical protein
MRGAMRVIVSTAIVTPPVITPVPIVAIIAGIIVVAGPAIALDAQVGAVGTSGEEQGAGEDHAQRQFFKENLHTNQPRMAQHMRKEAKL